jgi:DMSO/TMAO reductase YedYZ molybdopterin-dependent catalytic subunit
MIPHATCALALAFLFALPAAGQGAKPAIPDEQPVQTLEDSYNFSVEGRALDTIDELGVTGSPIDVDPVTWRLAVKGPAAARPVSLTYGDLSAMPRVNRVSLLICPGFFEDVAEWGGVPIADLLALAGVTPTWKELVVTSVDGYPARFSREEVDTHVFFVALTVNGKELPKAHGFPARLVAEGILGGQWVKWISSIEVQ